MLTTDLGACEWFVWDLRRSNLIDRGQLDQIISEFLSKNPGAEPPALAEFLVQREILTEFQAERLLQGKTQGFVLGPFTLMDALGSGSMGTVYKAQSKTDGNWYAVKVLPRRSMWNVRIARRKVRLFEQCSHPAVVPFIDVGTAGGMHYLAWPLVEGETLESIVEREGRLSPEQATQYALQTAEGLDICHRAGLFHGLLKPSNLMVSADGQIRILDYGIGCLLAETEGESLVDTMSTANSVNSGLDCASPESIMDPTNLTPVGDQYSLGCVLYFMVTGQYPFPDGTAVEKMMAHQEKEPTPIQDLVSGVPQGLIEVIECLMAKVPEHRFPNCSGVIAALKPFGVVGEAPVIHRRTSSLPSIQLPARPPMGAAQGSPAPLRSQRTSAEGAHPPVSPSQPRGGRGAPASEQPQSAPFPGRQAEVHPQGRHLQPAAHGYPAHPHAQPEEFPPGQNPYTHGQYPPRQETPSLGQRLGTTGVILLAVLAGAVAWLLSSMLKI